MREAHEREPLRRGARDRGERDPRRRARRRRLDRALQPADRVDRSRDGGAGHVPLADDLRGPRDPRSRGPGGRRTRWRRHEQIEADSKKALRTAVRAGVRPVCGTDAGTPFNAHGSAPREIVHMVEWGMPPARRAARGHGERRRAPPAHRRRHDRAREASRPAAGRGRPGGGPAARCWRGNGCGGPGCPSSALRAPARAPPRPRRVSPARRGRGCRAWLAGSRAVSPALDGGCGRRSPWRGRAPPSRRRGRASRSASPSRTSPSTSFVIVGGSTCSTRASSPIRFGPANTRTDKAERRGAEMPSASSSTRRRRKRWMAAECSRSATRPTSPTSRVGEVRLDVVIGISLGYLNIAPG